LLAEDEPINREIAEMLLADVGMRFDSAEDGEQAVELASRNTYDLILMDMQMPKSDGLEANATDSSVTRLLQPADYRADCQCLCRGQGALPCCRDELFHDQAD
jgi:FixJ family two-component response regulator